MNLGIMGLGSIAGKMANTVNHMKNVALYAVAARDDKKAKEFCETYEAVKWYGSYKELLEDEQVDLIYIATPHGLHYEHIKMCLENGKNVLCEKAFTLNSKQAMEVIKLAKEKNLFLCEAMWVRFMPMAKELTKILDEHLIGDVLSVYSNIGYILAQKERVVQPKLGGGALLDVGIYGLTFSTLVLGFHIKDITTTVVKLPTGVDAQENITLLYEDGKIANVYSCMCANTDKRGIIYGTKGSIEVENINNFEEIVVYDSSRTCIKRIKQENQISGYEYEVEACMKALALGKKECEEIPHDMTLAMMDLMDNIRKRWEMKYPGE